MVAMVETVMVAIRCTAERPHQTRHGWQMQCGAVVVRVPADAQWEEALNTPVEVPCSHAQCSAKYRLSDFLRV
jgi:hypothetical protein